MFRIQNRRKRMGFVTVLAGVILFSAARSDAFSLSDHSLITKLAVKEFNQCFPGAVSEDDTGTLVEKNLWEDINLLNKWIFYSHFFRPGDTLEHLWRSDASVRVVSLNSSSDSTVSLEALGGILHYIQDMASPPHVIPVMHGMTDGFETYTLSDDTLLNEPDHTHSRDSDENPENGPGGNPGISRLLNVLRFPRSMISAIPRISSLVSYEVADACRMLMNSPKSPDTLVSLLSETGIQTLHALPNFKVQGKSGGVPDRDFLVSDFWQEAPLDPSGERPYGAYGELGNRFGEPTLQVDDVNYTVSLTDYDRIKAFQLRLGIDATKKALAFWYQQKSQ